MNERTRMALAIVIAGVVLFGWSPLMRGIEHLTGWKLLPDPQVATTQPIADPAAPTEMPATQPGAIAGSDTQPTVTPLPPQLTPASAPSTAGRLTVITPPDAPAEQVLIGSAKPEDPQYAMQIALSPRGGGIAGVILNSFKRSVESNEPFIFEQPVGNTMALATQSITVRRQGLAPETVDLSNAVWKLEAGTAGSATLSLDLGVDGQPVLTIYKTFHIPTREEGGEDGPQGYDTDVKYSFVNRTDRPLTVSSVISGPTFPPSEQPRGGDRQVIGGYRSTNTIKIKHPMLESFAGQTTPHSFTLHDGLPMLWVGAGGNYFNAIVRPVGQQWIRDASAISINPQAGPQEQQVVITLVTADVTVAPGAQQELAAKVFFGPRWRALLNNAYYKAADVGYHHTLEISGACVYCTFTVLIDALMWLLAVFHAITRDWGIAIILLVFVVRALLHPITKRAQINMAKMQKFGPELERLKKKYANDKDALNRAMMQFYKEQGATPILGCLPMFLQMPIWIALYAGLSTTFELRLQPFLYGFTWIKDLAKPDHLVAFERPFSFLFLHLDGVNVLPILMAGAFWLQAKLQPKPPTMTPEQEQQQKMMQWMTLLFPLFLYSSPSGLNLYILTSTIFGIIENHIIRKHIKEREAREAAGPVIVDAEVINAEDLPRSRDVKKKSESGGGLMGWFASLQERAEQLRQEAERKAREQQRKKKS